MRQFLKRLFRSRANSTASRLPFQPRAGQLLSVETEAGDFAVFKVLAADRGGVHVRLFVQRFPVRPSLGDVRELSLASFRPEDANPFSIGHMPLSYPSFAAWSPKILGQESVTYEELEGHQMWLDANGGYF